VNTKIDYCGVQRNRVAAASLQRRRVSFWIFAIIVSIFMVACGGPTPQAPAPVAPATRLGKPPNTQKSNQPNTTVASQGNTPGQNTVPPTVDTSQANAPAANPGTAPTQAPLPGTEEFGLTKEGLVKSIEAVESLIAECMSDAGFEYIAVDYNTVRRGMTADKSSLATFRLRARQAALAGQRTHETRRGPPAPTFTSTSSRQNRD
jgi:hypothetical protein